MLIIEGTSGNLIGKGLARLGNFNYAAVESRIFPDGESYIKMPRLDEKSVAIVQSAYAPQDKHLLELLFMASELREHGCDEIVAIIPYLAYARQNKRFEDNEAVGISTLMKLINSSGVDSIITVEPHRYEIMKMFAGKSKIVEMSEAISLAIKNGIEKPVILSPDKGGIERAKKVADITGCSYDYIEKARDYATGEVSAKASVSEDLRGRNVAIVDDIISTGGTVEQAARIAKSCGSNRVIAAAAHLVMANGAYERIRNAGVSELYGTNTIPYNSAKLIDISEYVLRALNELRS